MEFISCIKNFPRHFKSALQNLRRNFVMTLSSALTVTFTLMLIGVIVVAAFNLETMAGHIEKSLTIYAKVDRTLTDEEAKEIEPSITGLEGVSSVEFSSKDDELNKLIESQNESGQELFESYRENNPLGAAYTITTTDDADISSVAKQIENIDSISEVNYGGETTASLIKTLKLIRNGSIGVSIVLGVIAILLISNTIKMAIESRAEEIKIMRLVGASNWYIKLPYMIEGMLIGVIGAILPILILSIGYPLMYNSLHGFLPTIIQIIEPFPFVLYMAIGIVAIGILVGIIGSHNATRRYLKH